MGDLEGSLAKTQSDEKDKGSDWIQLIAEELGTQIAASSVLYGFDFENGIPIPGRKNRFIWARNQTGKLATVIRDFHQIPTHESISQLGDSDN